MCFNNGKVSSQLWNWKSQNKVSACGSLRSAWDSMSHVVLLASGVLVTNFYFLLFLDVESIYSKAWSSSSCLSLPVLGLEECATTPDFFMSWHWYNTPSLPSSSCGILPWRTHVSISTCPLFTRTLAYWIEYYFMTSAQFDCLQKMVSPWSHLCRFESWVGRQHLRNIHNSTHISIHCRKTKQRGWENGEYGETRNLK